MNLEQIRAEVQDRGYNYLPTSRIDLWIKQTYEWVCSVQPWPFLEATIAGAAPLDIPDLSQILYVAGPNTGLDGADLRDILDADPALTETGTATNWYLEGNTVKIWPAEAGVAISVRYIKQPPALTDLDSPLLPSAYHEILVDGAVLRGLKDNDEYDTAQALQAVIDMQVEGMKVAILNRNYQNPTSLVQSGDPEDYGA
jgi:hypothetical protein